LEPGIQLVVRVGFGCGYNVLSVSSDLSSTYFVADVHVVIATVVAAVVCDYHTDNLLLVDFAQNCSDSTVDELDVVVVDVEVVDKRIAHVSVDVVVVDVEVAEKRIAHVSVDVVVVDVEVADKRIAHVSVDVVVDKDVAHMVVAVVVVVVVVVLAVVDKYFAVVVLDLDAEIVAVIEQLVVVDVVVVVVDAVVVVYQPVPEW